MWSSLSQLGRSVRPVGRRTWASYSPSPDHWEGRPTRAGEPPGQRQPVNLAFKAYESRPRKSEPGHKSPLLMHHSLLGSQANWKSIAKEINHLTRRQVVTVDARNHGESPHALEMSYSLMARDVKRLVDHLEMDRLSFMGHTMGGRIGMILALTQPELIDKLICVDATPFDSEISIHRWRTLREACVHLQAMEPELRSTKGMERKSLADKAIQDILTDSRDRSLFLTNLLCDPISGQDPNVKSPLWRINIHAFLDNPNMTSSFPKLKGATFPGKVMFIAGDRSKFVKRQDEERIRAMFPNAKFVWIPNCGHWIQTDKHVEFLKAVLPFLENK